MVLFLRKNADRERGSDSIHLRPHKNEEEKQGPEMVISGLWGGQVREGTMCITVLWNGYLSEKE